MPNLPDKNAPAAPGEAAAQSPSESREARLRRKYPRLARLFDEIDRKKNGKVRKAARETVRCFVIWGWPRWRLTARDLQVVLCRGRGLPGRFLAIILNFALWAPQLEMHEVRAFLRRQPSSQSAGPESANAEGVRDDAVEQAVDHLDRDGDGLISFPELVG